MNVKDLEGKKILMAGSGGLDSCTIIHWLTQKGVQVLTFTGDMGQPDENDMQDARQRMLSCGATEVMLVDLKEPISRAGIRLVQAQARYEGGYWNTTGMARYVLVKGMIREMQEKGIQILGHGATGRGNDQVRFQLASQMLDAKVLTYAPWRDPSFLQQFGGRKEMIDYCESYQLPIRASRQKPYSTDSNMLGLTHEAGKLEALDTAARSIEPGMGVFPEHAPDRMEICRIRFERGVPVTIGDDTVTPVAAIESCNAIAGRNGVGIGLHAVENRFVGIKSRGVYEAPGLELLGQCYEYLLQLLLDRRARRSFDAVSSHIAEQIYQGYWFDTSTRASWQLVEQFNTLATGTITVALYKGNVSFQAAEGAPHSIYSKDTASMEDIGDFDHKDSEGFLGVLGVGARALNRADQTGIEVCP